MFLRIWGPEGGVLGAKSPGLWEGVVGRIVVEVEGAVGFRSYFISSVMWAMICILAGMNESRRMGLSSTIGGALWAWL